ncbi:MAG: hypothetical protein ABR961_16325 [Thermoanaerobaculaceae bacterium]
MTRKGDEIPKRGRNDEQIIAALRQASVELFRISGPGKGDESTAHSGSATEPTAVTNTFKMLGMAY